MSEAVSKADFNSTYSEIAAAVARLGEHDVEANDAFAWLDKVLEYNVKNGKHSSGYLVAACFQAIVKSPEESDVKTAYILGWCIEMFQAYSDVSFDFISQKSLNRQGNTCWHRKDDVGILSINDTVLIESAMYQVMKSYTEGKDFYTDLIELFQFMNWGWNADQPSTSNTPNARERHLIRSVLASLHTVIGKRIELSVYSNGQLDLGALSMSVYDSISVYRHAFSFVYLPAACAMYMAGIRDEAAYSEAKKILLEIGQLLKIQEDYNQWFCEDPSDWTYCCHNRGTSCTWLAVQAHELSSDKEKLKLQDLYKEDSEQAWTEIRRIYRSKGLETVYRSLKETRLQRINQMIESSQARNFNSIIFTTILDCLFAPGDSAEC